MQFKLDPCCFKADLSTNSDCQICIVQLNVPTFRSSVPILPGHSRHHMMLASQYHQKPSIDSRGRLKSEIVRELAILPFISPGNFTYSWRANEHRLFQTMNKYVKQKTSWMSNCFRTFNRRKSPVRRSLKHGNSSIRCTLLIHFLQDEPIMYAISWNAFARDAL